MFVLGEQASLIFEGAAEIRISIHLSREKKPDNTTHVGQEGTTSGYSSRRDQRVWSGPTSP
jgi:hypothetical protein